ncbi:chitinase [Streptomyces sp. NBC_01089]|uniref:chitinase n=1 Tax=Streptomyces sp. NBC_01089 TaxID=2903747 RepID=UPI00386DC885|nr:chitinase [Streptomyces sp. NBC_01089]
MRRRPPTTSRRTTSASRAAAVLAAAGLAVAGAALTAGPAAATPVSVKAAASFAPYTDMSNSQEGLLDTAITQHGVKTFTAGFVIGSGCNQIWGDTLPVGGDSYTDPLISNAKSEGASVIVSSGGAAGLPLAWSCTDQSAINAGYQKIIDSYGPSSLDFDIEGGAIADTAAAARNMSAMKTLKAANPGLTFSVTLPVLPDGLTADGVNILKAAKDAGVKIDVVNVMTMDYYQGSQDMGQAAISAGKATLAQMQSVDPSYTYANLGITPMIGVNDDGSVFSTADASTVKSWADSNGVGRLSYWSVNRDQSCGSVTTAASPTCSGVTQGQLAFADILGG